MSTTEPTSLEQRVAELERKVAALVGARAHRTGADRERWPDEVAGLPPNDPVFAEMIRLGREYRQSLTADEEQLDES